MSTKKTEIEDGLYKIIDFRLNKGSSLSKILQFVVMKHQSRLLITSVDIFSDCLGKKQLLIL